MRIRASTIYPQTQLIITLIAALEKWPNFQYEEKVTVSYHLLTDYKVHRAQYAINWFNSFVYCLSQFHYNLN